MIPLFTAGGGFADKLINSIKCKYAHKTTTRISSQSTLYRTTAWLITPPMFLHIYFINIVGEPIVLQRFRMTDLKRFSMAFSYSMKYCQKTAEKIKIKTIFVYFFNTLNAAAIFRKLGKIGNLIFSHYITKNSFSR